MSFFSSALLAAALVVQAPTEVPEKKVFAPLIAFDNYSIGVNVESITILGTKHSPLIGLDMEMILTDTLKRSPQDKIPIKSFVNTVVADCSADVLLVVVSRGFDVDGKLLFSTSGPTVVAPKPNDLTPSRLILKFACGPIRKIEKNKLLDAKAITTKFVV